MKKKIALLAMSAAVLLVLPVRANACGGFIAVRGEKLFHSVYCDELKWAELDKLRWFNTAQEAERSGLKMCEACAEHIESDFVLDDCFVYFESSDPLTITAMERSAEYGEEVGFEIAKEELGLGYDSGYEAGYEDGYSAAKLDAEYLYRKQEEEREKANQLSELQTLCILVALFLCFSVFCDFLSASWAAFRRKEVKSSFGRLIEDTYKFGGFAPLVIGAMFFYGIISLI